MHDEGSSIPVMAVIIPDGRNNSVQAVRQLDANGCGLAVFAMLAGFTYDQAKALPQFANHDWEKTGIDQGSLDCVLADYRIALSRQYAYRVGLGEIERRAQRPWPPALFADVHLGMVRNASISHFIVILRDGTVFDPLCEQPRRMSDYSDPERWCWIAGVCRMPHMSSLESAA